jgi:hypothetical protein
MSNGPTLYHLGCGDTHLDGYVNFDVRATAATNVTADLNLLELPQPASGVFSHAFFEHLLRDAPVPHLIAARQLLTEGGFVCYLGLPDLRAVAEHYLLQLGSLEWVDGRTRSQIEARIAGSPLRRRLRPFTTRVARRLARV